MISTTTNLFQNQNYGTTGMVHGVLVRLPLRKTMSVVSDLRMTPKLLVFAFYLARYLMRMNLPR